MTKCLAKYPADLYEICPAQERIWTPLDNVYLSLINTGTSTDPSRHEEKKIKLVTIASHIYFLFEGCFCFPTIPNFPKHIKFGQNFVTKKPKQKIETSRLVPTYRNKYLQNYYGQMMGQG